MPWRCSVAGRNDVPTGMNSMKVESYWSHSFVPGLMRADGIVFDFGVNSGGFAEIAARLCRKVVGFEPDPSWQGRLRLPDNVTLLSKAVAAEQGMLRLHVNTDKCSSLHYADTDAALAEVEAITLAQAFALEPQGRIELVKMDIEGEEVPVLLRADAALFDRVAQMTIEFHDFLDPASLPRIQEVISRLEKMGFFAVRMSWRSYGDMLFINEKLEPLTVWQRVWLKYIHKYSQGVKRILKRWLQKR